MKSKKTRGLFDEEFRIEKIKKKDPLTVLHSGVNWEQFRVTVESAFLGVDYSKGGRPPFDRLLMFKVLVLQEYYGLSDDQMEFQLLDRLSFQRFIGQGLHDVVPDAKTIWLYRQTLTNAGVIDRLFEQLGKQLKKLGLVANKGSMIDASFVKVPVQRNTPDENDQIKGGDTPDWDEPKARQKDTDADWTRKGNERHYGYKQHVKADVESKLITNFEVTPASVHDSNVFEELLDKQDAGTRVYADSAYYSEERIAILKALGIDPGLLTRNYRNRTLTQQEKELNRKLSSRRCRIEHIFAWLKQWGRSRIRGVGIARITARVTLRMICYNLSRAIFLLRNNKKEFQII